MIFLRTNFSRLHFLIAIFSISSFLTGILTSTGVLEYNAGLKAHLMFVGALLVFPTLFLLTHKNLKLHDIKNKLYPAPLEHSSPQSFIKSKLPIITASIFALIYASGFLAVITNSLGYYFSNFHIILTLSIPLAIFLIFCGKIVKDLIKVKSISSK